MMNLRVLRNVFPRKRVSSLLLSTRMSSTTPEEEKVLNSLVYLDVKVGSEKPTKVTIELFDHIVPETAKNFRLLCTGEMGFGYQGSKFHRGIKGFMVQGGDFNKFNGSGGFAAVGNGRFDDENFLLKHTRRGLLSMANSGPNTNGSQFFITFAAAPWLDDNHVVFGMVKSGMEVLDKIENLCLEDETLARSVRVVGCGVMGSVVEKELLPEYNNAAPQDAVTTPTAAAK